MRWLILPIAVAAILTAVGIKRFDPPGDAAAKITPVARVSLSPQAKDALHSELVRVSADSGNRKAQEVTLRIRNVSCGFMATGSGFALTRRVIVTNEHVVKSAVRLELNTWDGRSFHVDIDHAASSRLNDLAVIVLTKPLPYDVKIGATVGKGDPISVVGYPGGGPLTISRGRVLYRVTGSSLGSVSVDGTVLVIDAPIEHGNSGGPVLNASGELVGVIYAGLIGPASPQSKKAYAIPVRTLLRLLQRPGRLDPIRPC